MASSEEKKDPSIAKMVSAMNEQSDDGGTNIMKYSIKTFSNPDGSDKKGDAIVSNMEEALVLLKELIEYTKSKTKKEKKKVKWEFKTSPHEQFGKTLDDCFMGFVVWAKVKHDSGDDNDDEDNGDKENEQYNVSKAFRRLESYAEWMDEAGDDICIPSLTAVSVKDALDAFKMKVSYDKNGNFVWWFDLSVLDKEKIKNEIPITSSLRAFVWYAHFIMYDSAAQKKGMVLVENCAYMGFWEMMTLMPMKLGAKLDRLTIGVMPVKLLNLYVLETPGWMKNLMKVLGMFMSKKLKKRIKPLKKWDEVGQYLGEDCIPKGFGKLDGKLEVDVVEEQYFTN